MGHSVLQLVASPNQFSCTRGECSIIMPRNCNYSNNCKLHRDKAAITDITAHRLHKRIMRLEYVEKQLTEQNDVS